MVTTIFDLDHTLLNSQELKEELAKIMGISLTIYKGSYKEALDRDGGYSFEKHIKFLQEDEKIKEGDIKFQSIKNKFNKGLPNLSNFLFDKYSEVIKSSGEDGSEKILLTFGNKEWQRKKLKKLPELKPLFDRIIIEEKEKEKSEILKELAEKDEKV